MSPLKCKQGSGQTVESWQSQDTMAGTRVLGQAGRVRRLWWVHEEWARLAVRRLWQVQVERAGHRDRPCSDTGAGETETSPVPSSRILSLLILEGLFGNMHVSHVLKRHLSQVQQVNLCISLAPPSSFLPPSLCLLPPPSLSLLSFLPSSFLHLHGK